MRLRAWHTAPIAAVLVLGAVGSGCAAPRAVGKAASGIARGAGKVASGAVKTTGKVANTAVKTTGKAVGAVTSPVRSGRR